MNSSTNATVGAYVEDYLNLLSLTANIGNAILEIAIPKRLNLTRYIEGLLRLGSCGVPSLEFSCLPLKINESQYSVHCIKVAVSFTASDLDVVQ
jgi:hypothetical protein